MEVVGETQVVVSILRYTCDYHYITRSGRKDPMEDREQHWASKPYNYNNRKYAHRGHDEDASSPEFSTQVPSGISAYALTLWERRHYEILRYNTYGVPTTREPHTRTRIYNDILKSREGNPKILTPGIHYYLF